MAAKSAHEMKKTTEAKVRSAEALRRLTTTPTPEPSSTWDTIHQERARLKRKLAAVKRFETVRRTPLPKWIDAHREDLRFMGWMP